MDKFEIVEEMRDYLDRMDEIVYSMRSHCSRFLEYGDDEEEEENFMYTAPLIIDDIFNCAGSVKERWDMLKNEDIDKSFNNMVRTQRNKR